MTDRKILSILISVLILGSSAWATTINSRVEKIAGLEADIKNIKENINDIKEIMRDCQKGMHGDRP